MFSQWLLGKDLSDPKIQQLAKFYYPFELVEDSHRHVTGWMHQKGSVLKFNGEVDEEKPVVDAEATADASEVKNSEVKKEASSEEGDTTEGRQTCSSYLLASSSNGGLSYL